MTFLRAVIRRNLVYNPESEVIERGYELEAMAKKITGCGHWNVTMWGPCPGEDPPATGSPPGQDLPATGSPPGEDTPATGSPPGEDQPSTRSPPSEGPPATWSPPDDRCRLATDVMDTRQRLGELSR